MSVLSYRTKKEAVADALAMGLTADAVSGSNKRYYVTQPADTRDAIPHDLAENETRTTSELQTEFMRILITKPTNELPKEVTMIETRNNAIDEDIAAREMTDSEIDDLEESLRTGIACDERIDVMTDEEAAKIEAELDEIYNACDPARLAVPHDLAEDEAEQSAPVDMSMLDAESFVRIFIAKPSDIANDDAEFFNSVIKQSKPVAAAKSKRVTKETPWGYRGAPKKASSTAFLIWTVLDAHYEKTQSREISKEIAIEIANQLNKSLSTVYDQIRFWKFFNQSEVTVANEVEPVSIDEVEVTEV